MTDTPPRRTLASFLRRPDAGRKATGEASLSSASDPTAPTDTAPEALDHPSPVATADRPEDEVAPASASPTPSDGAAAPSVEAHGLGAPAATTDEAAPSDTLALDEDTEAAAASMPAPSHTSLPADAAPAWSATPVAAAPNFARARSRTPSPRAPAWQWCALATLGLLLALQILLADRARLAADARWRPWVESLCGVLGCALPPWHEPSAFTMQDRDVRPVPGQGGQLRVQASIRNDARWAQAWPWLQLSLSDADGRIIGTRVFSPAEYLGHAPEAPALLTPGQSGRIDFRVREPAAGTAAFSFEFR